MSTRSVPPRIMAPSPGGHARGPGADAHDLPSSTGARGARAPAGARARVVPGAVAMLAAASMVALAGCTTFPPWARDDGTVTPPDVSDAGKAAEPKPVEHEDAEGGEAAPEPALEVAVLDPEDYERGISRRKRALAGTIDEPASAEGTGYYMDVQEAQLRQALAGTSIGLFRQDQYMLLRISGTEAFETGSAQLNPAIHEPLATVADVLKDYQLTLVAVHGHTDALGEPAHNQRLSEQRAIAVARHLAEHGLAAERIAAVGHGESRPLQHETSPDSRWPDRRIEIRLELIRP